MNISFQQENEYGENITQYALVRKVQLRKWHIELAQLRDQVRNTKINAQHSTQRK